MPGHPPPIPGHVTVPPPACVDTRDDRPGAADAVITLDEGASQRVGDALVGSAAAVTRYALGGFFAGLAFGVGPVAAPTLTGRVLAAALAVGLFAFGRWGRKRVCRAVNFDTKLVVHHESIVIRHPMLAAPLRVPRDNVRLVAGDPDASASSRHSLPVFSTTGESRLTWLWQRHSGGLIPMLGPPGRAPNLVLLFNRPVDFPTRARSAGRHAPRPSLAEAGVLLRVNDPTALAQAFADCEDFRAPVGDDLAHARELGRQNPCLPFGA